MAGTSKSPVTGISLGGAVKATSGDVKLIVAEQAMTVTIPAKTVVVLLPLKPENSKSGKAVLLANSHGYATTDVSIEGRLAWVSCNVGVSGVHIDQ